MPMYEYACETCEDVTSKIVSFADADAGVTFPCAKCGGEHPPQMKRVDKVYTPGHQYKGHWFRNHGSY